ncbi:protein kinase domain-containing protein [Actinophytocola sp.]|uniref:protein kinase domain-containing protein n=1 Tax=Actinophytocola sp. TaxID=1872138 RepID=UPI002ED31151
MEEGELVAERYRLVSLVGQGAMGVVWLARDERLDREVAVKQLLIAGSPDKALATATSEEATSRAMREARIAARLRHHNAIAVHDVVEHDGRPCLIMEYLRSSSLDQVMIARGGLPPIEVAAIGAQIAAALTEAHAAGIVHRDIKPENVLFNEDGTAKITDFGVSRAAFVGTVTTTGILAGTPAYLAPEVASGGPAGPSSDVFSLGATLYTAIEGMPPFGIDDNPIALLLRVATGEMKPPERTGPLTDLVMWLLHRDPAQRPSMMTARDALAAAAEGEPFPVPRARTGTIMLPPPRRRVGSMRTVVFALIAVTLVAAGAALGWGITDGESTSATPQQPGTSTPGAPPQQPILAEPTCVASYEVAETWQGGYNATVTIRNDGESTLSGWTVRWTQPDGHQITNLWNGDLTRAGTEMTVTNAQWNTTVPTGGETSFGFTANAKGNNRPTPAVTCGQR